MMRLVIFRIVGGKSHAHTKGRVTTESSMEVASTPRLENALFTWHLGLPENIIIMFINHMFLF